MAVRAIAFVLCIIVAGNEIAGKSLPSYIKPCKRDDPGVNDCLKKLVEDLRPFISKGIAEMHILPLDPMVVPSVIMNQGSSSVNFEAIFTDLKGFGAKNYQVQKLEFDLKNRTIEINFYLPSFKIESRYAINGKILVLPIKGNGKLAGNFTNVKSNIKLGIKLVEKKNGKTFIEITDHRVNLTFGAVKLHFSNLFNGNKELGDQTNRFINDNWKELLKETGPLIDDTIATIILGIFTPVFTTYSMDELFVV